MRLAILTHQQADTPALVARAATEVVAGVVAAVEVPAVVVKPTSPPTKEEDTNTKHTDTTTQVYNELINISY